MPSEEIDAEQAGRGASKSSLRRLYDPAMYRFGEPVESFWRFSAGAEPQGLGAPLGEDGVPGAEVAIIGGGVTGLAAALRLAEAGREVIVLEAGLEIGWGASGRNGGFVSAGGVKLDHEQIAARHGLDGARDYVRSQREAVDLVAELIERCAIDCDKVGDAVWRVAHSPAAAQAQRAEAPALRDRFGEDVEYLDAAAFRARVHDGAEMFGGLREAPGFGVHPLKYVRGLARAAQAAGARLLLGAEVVAWAREAGRQALTLRGGQKVGAKRVIVAANGYLPDGLAPALDRRALPAISSIVVTQRYSEAEWTERGFHSLEPVYNARHLLYYYRRLPDGRLMFGGRGDTTGAPREAAARSAAMLDGLRNALPAFADARAEFAWNGLVALTRSRALGMGALDSEGSAFFALGCHGTGVATMSWAGDRLARMILADDPAEIWTPEAFRTPTPRLPASGALRRLGLRAAYLWYGVADRFGL